MSKVLPYSMQDVGYDNDKFRPRSYIQGISQAFATKNIKRSCAKCTTGRFLLLLMICGVIYLITVHKTPVHSRSTGSLDGVTSGGQHTQTNPGGSRIGRLLRKPPRLPPRLPPQLPPDKLLNKSSLLASNKLNSSRVWAFRQEAVRKAFVHAWSGYKNYAMGYDELMPLSRRGTDGLGGLGATVVDSLDTAIIMGIDDVVSDAGTWIQNNLSERINQKGQVNLFETTIRVLGGLLSAYHLQGGDPGTLADMGIPAHVEGPKAKVYLETAKNLADRLLSAFTSSPTPIPFSDVILRDRSAHPAPNGLSSTAEVSTLQLEFNYLSDISGDPKYGLAAMKVFEHLKTLPKVQGLVPIYISPHSGQFSGENIRLGSRGDSYYEYLIKVWLHQGGSRNSRLKYLHDMYEEAMKGVMNLLLRKSIPKGLVFVGELPYGHGGGFSPKMDHLVCFLPGTLALGATKGITRRRALKDKLLTADDVKNLQLAEDLAKTCFEMYSVTATGLAPEIAYFHIEGGSEEHLGGGNQSSEYVNDITIKHADRHNLLRPETVESLFVLYRITEDPKYREWGWRIFEAFERHTKVDSGGYSSLDDVTVVPAHRRDKMETFFLGETLKYLYLLFGDSNVLPLDKFVFNTEAHPLPIRRVPN
ncbi:unnamed protein product [Spirodela intermedia]|uniref:alpha-1,2-Mannosidase n=1 Tax=Spirodela intermedia TaxID=51605 RepID=A0A7I8LKR1_SPIIN|nr:unnamed protein product [Spirodela intermedia]